MNRYIVTVLFFMMVWGQGISIELETALNSSRLIDYISTVQLSLGDLNSLLKLDAARYWMFKISEVYKGRRYYLSIQNPLQRSEKYVTTCQFYGGYLAEINDLEEFNVVKTFVQQFSGFRMVLTGGTDEQSEEVWKYRQSNTPVPDFLVKSRKWGKTTNCLYLDSQYDWYGVDDLCYYTNPCCPTRFLCEIPQN